MLLKVAEMNNKLLTFWKNHHFFKKNFRWQNFVSVHIMIRSLKISHKIGWSVHKFSCKSGGKLKNGH